VILVLLRAAEADIEEAFRWYEARRVGLGHDFVAEVDSAFERALEAPSSFPVAYRGLRRIVLKRFPYLVYFREHDEAVQVFGVLHGRRDRRRLRRRSILP
jgi:toxin ParE1/3/4